LYRRASMNSHVSRNCRFPRVLCDFISHLSDEMMIISPFTVKFGLIDEPFGAVMIRHGPTLQEIRLYCMWCDLLYGVVRIDSSIQTSLDRCSSFPRNILCDVDVMVVVPHNSDSKHESNRIALILEIALNILFTAVCWDLLIALTLV
jgi:hypothetical protein